MKILFIVKKRTGYTDYDTIGLVNASSFVVNYLKDIGIEAEIKEAIDGNCIDRLVTEYNPEYVIIEALFITPAKFQELFTYERHRNRQWIVRIHSKIPFLSQEGIAISWIKEYTKLGILIAPNNSEVTKQFDSIGIPSITLPNIYYPKADKHNDINMDIDSVHIGCMGAIRPMKNILLQAFAAIDFADRIGKKLYFYVNATRNEQFGENNLKNIRALFENTTHKLVEVGWLNHLDFLRLISTLDIGMQVSFTESFNLVTADFVYEEVPILVSDDINWMDDISRVSPTEYEEIVKKLLKIYECPKKYIKTQTKSLKQYNKKAKQKWREFLGIEEKGGGLWNVINNVFH